MFFKTCCLEECTDQWSRLTTHCLLPLPYGAIISSLCTPFEGCLGNVAASVLGRLDRWALEGEDRGEGAHD